MHLYAVITAHGYGHLAQAAPVLNALHERVPRLRLTLQCALPEHVLRARIHGDFELIAEEADVGMIMNGALTVLAEESARAYAQFHRDWEMRVENFAARLRTISPDLVLSNVAYLPLAAARRAGIPSVAMCSLNWADLYAFCCGAYADARLHAQILRAYLDADAFLQPEPSMPMEALPNRRAVAPVARLGRDRRGELRERLNLRDETRMVVLSLGGIPTSLSFERWPHVEGVHWLIPRGAATARGDMTAVDEAGMEFIDALRSADALVTKPGYGSFVEAACNGIPVLYVPRDDWPEAPFLASWLHSHARCMEIGADALVGGIARDTLTALWAQPAPAPTPAAGAKEAADILLELLQRKADEHD